ncbi:MAG: hypothetical protein L6Q57_09750 [Alphaproteobacteria bacterium]|nr:hypothetical protein [Alphaproteobacteria bacterium]
MANYARNTKDRTETPNQSYASAAHSIQEDLKTLKEDGAKLASHLTEDGIEMARSAATQLGEQVQYAKAYAAENMKTLEREVKDKPMQSVFLAFMAGIAMSMLFGRR